MQVYSDELYHFGVKGMKWGRRKTYGVMPKMITKKRQLDADKRTLDKMNNENHSVSFGITKKRQAVYDERDKKILEKRIDKNTKKLNKQSEQKKKDKAMRSKLKTEKQAFKKEYKQMYKDQLRHPVHSTAEQIKLLKTNPVKAFNLDLKTAKQLNDAVKKRVDNEARSKKQIKEYRKQINEGSSMVGKIYNKLTDADKYQAQLMYSEKHKNR